MITARMARELAELKTDDGALSFIQSAILLSAQENLRTAWVDSCYLKQKDIDFLRDLGYIVNEVEGNNGIYAYYISW